MQPVYRRQARRTACSFQRGHLPWLPEYHVCLKVFSDASDFAWGGIISIPGSPPFKTRDYWKPEMLHLPIVVKEARALVMS